MKSVDVQIIGQIIDASSVIQSLSTKLNIVEFCTQTLISIPGVNSCIMCLSDISHNSKNIDNELCTECRAKRKATSDIETFPKNFICKYSELSHIHQIVIETDKFRFGFFIFDVEKKELFESYTPFINNLGNFIAISLENRLQKNLLQNLPSSIKQESEEALNNLNRKLRAISNCNQILLRVDDEKTLLSEICHIICDEAGYRMSWVGYAENNEYKSIYPVAWSGFEDGYLAVANLSWSEDRERGRGPAGTAIRNNKIIYSQDFANDPQMAPWRENAIQRGYQSAIALPLKDETAKVFGVLLIYSSEPNAFNTDEIQLLDELAGDLAYGITALRIRAERKQVEHERITHLRFFESMDRINRAISGTIDIERMMNDVLNVVLSIFDCDRAWLFYPCNPDSPTFRVPMEVSKPEYPGANLLNVDLPMPTDMAENLREALKSDGPLTFTNGTEKPINKVSAEQFGVKSMMMTAIYPKLHNPWVFGLHQCSYPRLWTSEDSRLFQEIASRLTDALNSFIVFHDLQESEERYRIVFENSPVSIWEVDFSKVKPLLDEIKNEGIKDIETYFVQHPETVQSCVELTKIINVNQAALSMHRAENKQELLTSLVNIFTPESFDTFRQHLVCLWNGKTELIRDEVVRTLNGVLRNVTVYFFVCPGYEATFSKVLVSLIDITERKQNEEIRFKGEQVFRTLVENSPDIIARYDHDCKRTYVNPIYLKEASLPQEGLLNTSPAQFSPLPADSAIILQNLIRKVLNTGIVEAVDVIWPKSDNVDHWYNIYAAPEFDRNGNVISVLTISRDITERKQTEDILNRINRELRAVSNCNQALVRAEDELSLINDICRIICDKAGYRMAWVGYAENDEAKTVRPVAWAGVEDGYLKIAKITWADNELGRGPTGIAIRKGEISYINDFINDPRMEPWRENAIKRGYRSVIALPLKDENTNVFGALMIYSSEPDALIPAEIRLLDELSGDLSFGITTLRTRAERKIALEMLQKRETALLEAQHLGRIGSWDWDAITDTITWSKEYYLISGFDPSQPPPGYDEHLKAYTPESIALLDAAVKRNMQTGEPYEVDLEYIKREGLSRWITARSETKYDQNGKIVGLRGTAQDITERKRVEQVQQRLNRELRAISICNQTLLRVDDEQTLLNEICRIICEEVGYYMAWVGYAEQDKFKTIRPVAWAGAEQGYLDSAKFFWSEDTELGCGPAGIAIRSGEIVYVQDFMTDHRIEPWRENVLKHGFRCCIDLPLKDDDDITFGLLLIYSSEPNAINPDEIRLLEELANDLAFGIITLRIRAEREQALETLMKSEQRKTIFNKIAGVFLTIPDKEMSSGILEIVLQEMNSKFGIFGFIDEKENLVIPSWTEEVWSECQVLDKTPVFPSDSWGNSLWGKAIKNKKTYCSNGPFHTPEGHLNIECFLAVPILFGNKSIGLISVANSKTVYSNEDKELLEDIVKFVSPILNARLQRDKQEKVRKLAEEALVISEERFLKIFRLSPIAIVIFRVKDGCIIDANDTFINQSAYTREELIGQTALKLQLYADIEERNTILESLRVKGSLENYEFKVRNKFGDVRIALNTTIELNLDGEKHYMSLIQDITARKLAEEELNRMYRAVEQSPVSIVITDIQGNLKYVNSKFTELTGYTRDEAIGKNPRILKSGEMSPDKYKQLWQTISSGKEWFGEFHNKKKNGELFWEFASISPIFDTNGSITHYLGVKEDITERKRTEVDLINAKEKAEESDRLKTAFLCNMSHEIRTPMNAIIGFSQFLCDPDIEPDKRKHFSEIIKTRSYDLLRIIEDILDVSKIEVGQMQIFVSDVNLKLILNELYEYYQFKINQTARADVLSLILSTSENLDNLVFKTDGQRLKQIFNNLLDNALKFTEKGSIEFGYKMLSASELLFFVKDSGIGIPEDKQEIVFDQFRQAEELYNTRQYGGTGLGLSIVKGLVALMNGKIWLESTLNLGSSFYFTLPMNFSDSTKGENINLKSQSLTLLREKTFLIVEDDEPNSLFLKHALSGKGIKNLFAYTGDEALDIIKNNPNIDVILMDIRLPDTNGLNLTRMIKKVHPNVIIIAQTAYATPVDMQECLDAGCDDYISKPLDYKKLMIIIENHLSKKL